MWTGWAHWCLARLVTAEVHARSVTALLLGVVTGESPGMEGDWTGTGVSDVDGVDIIGLSQTYDSRGACQTRDSTVTGDGEGPGMEGDHSLTELSRDEEKEVRFWARKLSRNSEGMQSGV